MQKQVCEFDITDLLPIGFTLIVAGIRIAYGLSVVADMRDGFPTCHNSSKIYNVSSDTCETSATDGLSPGEMSAEFNASNDAIAGVARIPEKMPLIATVIVAAVIIGILVRYLMVRFT